MFDDIPTFCKIQTTTCRFVFKNDSNTHYPDHSLNDLPNFNLMY